MACNGKKKKKIAITLPPEIFFSLSIVSIVGQWSLSCLINKLWLSFAVVVNVVFFTTSLKLDAKRGTDNYIDRFLAEHHRRHRRSQSSKLVCDEVTKWIILAKTNATVMVEAD